MRKMYFELDERNAILEIWKENFITGFEGNKEKIQELLEILNTIKIRDKTLISLEKKREEKKEIKKEKFSCCNKTFRFQDYTRHLRIKHRIDWWEEFIVNNFGSDVFSFKDLKELLKSKNVDVTDWTVYKKVEDLVKEGKIERVQMHPARFRVKTFDLKSQKQEEEKILRETLK